MSVLHWLRRWLLKLWHFVLRVLGLQRHYARVPVTLHIHVD